MKTQEIKGIKILIAGFDREGRSSLAFLQQNYPEAEITIADQKEIKVTGYRCFSGPAYLDTLDEFDTVIRTAGLSIHNEKLALYRQNGGHVTSLTNIFLSFFAHHTIGITGTKGKSTTTSLIFDMLKAQYSDVRLIGNIGKPALSYIQNTTQDTLFVMEMSSYQLEDARYSPHIAVLLEIEPEHLSYHITMDNYINAKAQITAHQTNNDYLIINPHHTITKMISAASPATIQMYGTDDADVHAQQTKIFLQDNLICDLTETKMIGKGNLENVMAATTVATIMKIRPGSIRDVLLKFQPLPHRLEKIAIKNNITFYNDSIATTPEATINALEALGSSVETLILGGYERGLNYDKLKKQLVQAQIKNLILFPDTGIRIWKELHEQYPQQIKNIHAYPVNSMKEAVSLAFENTEGGKIVLLSPAAASYNMYTNFEERGEMFKLEIQNYSSST